MISPPPIPTDWGWLAALLWLIWQIYAPKFFNIDTRFQEVVNGLNERIDRVGNRLDSIEEKQGDHIAITEIIAVETDNVNGDTVAEVLSDEDGIDRDDVVHNSPFVVGDRIDEDSDASAVD